MTSILVVILLFASLIAPQSNVGFSRVLGANSTDTGVTLLYSLNTHLFK
jgi:hypothetical protein